MLTTGAAAKGNIGVLHGLRRALPPLGDKVVGAGKDGRISVEGIGLGADDGAGIEPVAGNTAAGRGHDAGHQRGHS